MYEIDLEMKSLTIWIVSDRELVRKLNHKMPLVQFPEQIESNGKHDIGAYKRTYITGDVKRSDYLLLLLLLHSVKDWIH